ncbi:MAG TPA: MarR family transcriptional regulator [Anaeromyxobacteraceae bacterium]|nr:MarR family transcriptional regulator [Anaeromyxobacteraceae bacterium]
MVRPPPDDPSALLFFAFRALTAEPDRVLAEHGLSRVHHRILYFVGRAPGLRVGELLALLGVTKQALNRPLRELLQRGLVAGSTPAHNRRARELRLTPSGDRLERRLSGAQRRRFAQAFSAAGVQAEQGWREVMRLLFEPPA